MKTPPPQPSQPSSDPAAAAPPDSLLIDFRRLYRERDEALDEVSRAYHGTLLHLAVAADFRDDDTGVHLLRTALLAEALALALGESVEFSSMLRRAAPMHDIGKIGVPDNVLKKPGLLNADERAVMNRHTVIGAEILSCSKIPLLRLAADVALLHHERFDGTGYPFGRAGLDIPLAARIVAVVDFFDAVTMERAYRPAYSDELVLSMLQAQRGAAFDPRIADAFVAHAPQMIQLRDRINAHRPPFDSLLQ